MSEATLQGIMFRQVNTDQIPSEVQKAILFRQEAVIRQVLLLAAADLPHHTAADLQDLYQVVLTLQDHLLQDLHQGLRQVVDPHQVAVVLLQEGDSLKQYNGVKKVHSK
jgi:hypothetical protein